MDELGKRSLLTYLFLSAAILFLDWFMRANGANSRHNPAWLLISAIYGFFEWSWIVSAYLAAFVALVLGVESAKENHRMKLQRIKDADEAIKQRVSDDRARAARELAEAEKELEVKLRKQREEDEKIRKEQEYREWLQKRTPQEAVEAALRDFCKGGR